MLRVEGEFIEWFFWTLLEAGIIACAQGAALFIAVRVYRVIYDPDEEQGDLDRLDRFDERLDDQDERLGSIEERLDSMDKALEALLARKRR